MKTSRLQNVLKLLFVAIGINGLVLASAFSQEPSTVTTDAQKPKWALQFQINDNFSLTSFQGSTISLNKCLSNNRSFRMGLSLNTTLEDYDMESRIIEDNEDKSENNFHFLLTTQYVRNYKNRNKVTPFFGFGPAVQFNYDNEKNTFGTSSRTSVKTTSWGMGISGVIGVEYFIRNNLGLLAEYGSNLMYNRSKTEDITEIRRGENNKFVTTEDIDEKTTTIDFSPALVKFGLSIYF